MCPICPALMMSARFHKETSQSSGWCNPFFIYIYDENVAPKTERTSFLSTQRPVSDHQSYWHVHFYYFSPQIHARVSLSSAIRTQDGMFISSNLLCGVRRVRELDTLTWCYNCQFRRGKITGGDKRTCKTCCTSGLLTCSSRSAGEVGMCSLYLQSVKRRNPG